MTSYSCKYMQNCNFLHQIKNCLIKIYPAGNARLFSQHCNSQHTSCLLQVLTRSSYYQYCWFCHSLLWCFTAFEAQCSLSTCCCYFNLPGISRHADITLRCWYRSFYPLQTTQRRFDDVFWIPELGWLYTEIILADQIQWTGTPGMTQASAKRTSIHRIPAAPSSPV